MKSTLLVSMFAEPITRITGAAVVALLCAGCGQAVSPARPSPTDAASQSIGSVRTAHMVPFNGSLEGTVTVTFLVPPLASVHIAAAGTATHLGRFTVDIPHVVDFSTAAGTGTFTFTAANGDTLTADFTGRAQTDTPVFSIVEHATITGGTGRFEGAQGSFTVERSYDTIAGTTTGSFEGSISSPGSGTK